MCFGWFSGGGGSKTRVRNLTDKPVDIQIRVGSALMKAYRLRPGCSKTLKGSKICKNYSPRGRSTFFYDGSCEPYVWIHDPNASWTSVKQRYVSLDDLNECFEMKICRDAVRGTFSLLKISKT